jgi:hypothetical protein
MDALAGTEKKASAMRWVGGRGREELGRGRRATYGKKGNQERETNSTRNEEQIINCFNTKGRKGQALPQEERALKKNNEKYIVLEGLQIEISKLEDRRTGAPVSTSNHSP